MTAPFFLGANFRIVLGAALWAPGVVAQLLGRLGGRNLSSFSNFVNGACNVIMMGGTSAAHVLGFALTTLGERKRDGVETMITVLGKEAGFGSGELAAGLMNWRTLANVISPVLISRAFLYGQRTGRFEFMFSVMLVINVAAECFLRSLTAADLAKAKRLILEKKKR